MKEPPLPPDESVRLSTLHALSILDTPAEARFDRITRFATRLFDVPIVRSTIELAHNLNLQVVAEGVETQEIVDRLGALGCDKAQGYFFSRPLPADEFQSWLLNYPAEAK